MRLRFLGRIRFLLITSIINLLYRLSGGVRQGEGSGGGLRQQYIGAAANVFRMCTLTNAAAADKANSRSSSAKCKLTLEMKMTAVLGSCVVAVSSQP